jgi:hypothetical protein
MPKHTPPNTPPARKAATTWPTAKRRLYAAGLKVGDVDPDELDDDGNGWGDGGEAQGIRRLPNSV